MTRLRRFFGFLLHPTRGLLILFLLAVIGFVAFQVVMYWRAGSHLEQARQALTRGDLDRAEQRLQWYRQLRPDNPDVYLLLAQVARCRGEPKAFTEHLRNYQNSGGFLEAVQLEEMLMEVQTGQLDGNVEKLLWTYVARDHPAKLSILEAVARGYFLSYQLPKAQWSAEKWLSEQPDNIQGHFLLAQVLERLRLKQAAIEEYRKVVNLDPEHRSARLQLALLLDDTAQPREALEQYRYWHEKFGSSATTLLGLARCYRTIGETNRAKDYLKQLLDEYPSSVPGLVEQGKLELQVNRLDRAAKFLRRAAELQPFDRDAVYNLALTLQKQNNEEAKKWFTRAEEIAQKDREMKSLIEQLWQRPNDPDIRYQIGRLFFDLHQEEEGRRWLESALSKDPRHGPTHLALAEYFERLGQPQMATQHRRLWQQVAEKKK